MASDILTEFIDDAREHLQGASTHLLTLERDPGDANELNGLLRRIHTIKGNAGFLDLKGLFSLLHGMENVLQIVREQECTACSSDLFELLLLVLDTVESMLVRLESGKSDRVAQLPELLERIGALEKRLVTPEAEPVPPEKAPPAAAPRKPAPPPPPPAPTGREALRHLLNDLRNTKSPSLEWLTAAEADLRRARAGLPESSDARVGRAMGLVFSHAALLREAGRTPSADGVQLLAELVENLLDWLDVAGAGTVVSPILEVFPEDLVPDQSDFLGRVEVLARQRPPVAVFDLRRFTLLRSTEIGVLVTALKKMPDFGKVGLVLDPERQSGLIRVLRVMGVDRKFQLFEDTAEAEARLHI